MPDAARGRLVAAGGDARLRVRISPLADQALAAVVSASPLLELVPASEEVTLVHRADGSWVVTDDVFGDGMVADEPVLAAIPAESIAAIVPVLEHYLAYIAPLRMARACHDFPGLLRVVTLDCNGVTLVGAAAQNPQLPVVRNLWVGDRVCFAVENDANVTLSITLFDCAVSGRVQILGEARIPPMSRHVFWRGGTLGLPFSPSLSNGRTVGIDRIVASGTTSAAASLRALARNIGFAEVIRTVTRLSRDGLSRSRSAQPLDRWTSAMTSLKICAR